MEHNLLIRLFDQHCQLFIDGKIEFELFDKIEQEYNKRQKLFTICLN